MTIRSVLLVLLGSLSVSAWSEVNVFACEPEWAALSQTIGGDAVNVYSATHAMQDPHHIQARPSLIAKMRRADLLICSGAELEVGWLPLLLRKSANEKVQPVGLGYFMATDYVPLLGVRSNVDRSMGDVHASGNPHVHLNPDNMLLVAKALRDRMAKIDPENASVYKQNLQQFTADLKQASDRWQDKLTQLKGKKIVVHHDSWGYLSQWLNMPEVATLEAVPGLPPSSYHLSQLLKKFEHDPADLIVYASYQNGRPATWLSDKTGMPVVALNHSVDNWQEPNALVIWYEELLNKLMLALNKKV